MEKSKTKLIRIYIYGGGGKRRKFSDTLCFDPKLNVIEEIYPKGHHPLARSNHAMDKLGEKTFVMFGGTDEHDMNDFWVFCTNLDNWIVAEVLTSCLNQIFLRPTFNHENFIHSRLSISQNLSYMEDVMRSMKPSSKLDLTSDMWLLTVDMVSKSYLTQRLDVRIPVSIGSKSLLSDISIGSRWGHSAVFSDSFLYVLGYELLT